MIDVTSGDQIKQFGKCYQLCHVKDCEKVDENSVPDDHGKRGDFKKASRLAMDDRIKYSQLSGHSIPNRRYEPDQ